MSTLDLAAARTLRLRDGAGPRAPERGATALARTPAEARPPVSGQDEVAGATHVVRATWIGRAVAAWTRHRRIAAGLVALRELDERMLADLGLDRAGIDRAARSGRD